MYSREYLKRTIVFLAGAAVLGGCAVPDSKLPPEREMRPKIGADSAIESAQGKAIRYYIGKLPDRDYVRTYGDTDHPKPWYTAAEALGEIGKPAIPALMERLDTLDPHELMLALYALMLASQDPALQKETGGDYLRLDTVLTPDTNQKNRQKALDWWQRYRDLWHDHAFGLNGE